MVYQIFTACFSIWMEIVPEFTFPSDENYLEFFLFTLFIYSFYSIFKNNCVGLNFKWQS
jgi:hypothetical protein